MSLVSMLAMATKRRILVTHTLRNKSQLCSHVQVGLGMSHKDPRRKMPLRAIFLLRSI